MYWCLGMRSSGSTWIFNVVRKIATVLAPQCTIVGPYVERGAELPDATDPAELIIVKSHATDQAAADALGGRARTIWISIRDPRDCIASLMQYHDLRFDAALGQVVRDARFCMQFIAHPRARLFRYEAGFADRPATIDRIAAGFDGTLAAADRDRIFSETRRPAIEAFIQGLDQLPRALRPTSHDLVDPVTKWHRHHANRTGEVGRWRRTLEPRQAAEIEHRLGDWMNSLGYDTPSI
ncbi:MAG: hypothetical protein WDN25_15515 [Acetobacteraceae bacterium]